MRATEHAPRDPIHVLERRHGLAEVVERGLVVPVKRLRVNRPHPERELTFAESEPHYGNPLCAPGPTARGGAIEIHDGRSRSWSRPPRGPSVIFLDDVELQAALSGSRRLFSRRRALRARMRNPGLFSADGLFAPTEEPDFEFDGDGELDELTSADFGEDPYLHVDT